MNYRTNSSGARFIAALCLAFLSLTTSAVAAKPTSKDIATAKTVAAEMSLAGLVAAQLGSGKPSKELAGRCRGLVTKLIQQARTHTRKGHNALFPAGIDKRLGTILEDAAKSPTSTSMWASAAKQLDQDRTHIVNKGRQVDPLFDAAVDAATLHAIVGEDGKAATTAHIGAGGAVSLTAVVILEESKPADLAFRLAGALGRSSVTKTVGAKLRETMVSVGKHSAKSCEPPHCHTSKELASGLTRIAGDLKPVVDKLQVGAIAKELAKLTLEAFKPLPRD